MIFHKPTWRYGAALLLSLLGLLAASQLHDPYFKFNKSLDVLASVLRELESNYVEEIDPDEVMKTGVDAMLQSLDPYTQFFPEEEAESLTTLTTGEYGGIGAVISSWKGATRVMMLYKDCPAHKAGMRVGDIISQINEEDMTEQPLEHVSSLLKGMPNTPVQLKVVRQGADKPISFTLTREQVNLKNVPYFGKVQDDVGYIKLATFTTHAADEVQAALASLQAAGMQKLILDLRGNPGGILEEAIKVVNLFIEQDLVVVTTKGRVEAMTKAYATPQPAYDSQLPLIVLIDQKSASAAEIVAGVVQDYDRGLLIGANTFGKGLVQSTTKLGYNTQLKLTTGRYYLPSGRSIQKIDYKQHRPSDSMASEGQDIQSAFATQAGRIVYEQDGLTPDIEGEKWHWSPITLSLVEKGLIFDYATYFQAQQPHIPPARAFSLSDAQYQDFVTWLQDKDYPYAIEQSIDRLLAQAQQGAYAEEVQQHIKALKTQILQAKAEDLQRCKQEIKLALQEDIVSRYYCQEGAIEALLDHDRTLQKAGSFFQDMSHYYSLLKAAE